MGTRHLICIYADNACQVAQYGQWDGYPKGQGAALVGWLRSNREHLPLLRARAVDAAEVPEAEMERRWALHKDSWSRDYPHLSRNQGSALLPYLVSTESPEVLNKSDVSFAADSLFCEYAYVIDFDSSTFEVYKGFQRGAHDKGRFASLPVKEEDKEYAPVCLVATFPLTEIPDNWIALAFPDGDES